MPCLGQPIVLAEIVVYFKNSLVEEFLGGVVPVNSDITSNGLTI